jgi:hypothetical protein
MKPACRFLWKEKPKSNAGFFREDKTTVQYHTAQELAVPDFSATQKAVILIPL